MNRNEATTKAEQEWAMKNDRERCAEIDPERDRELLLDYMAWRKMEYSFGRVRLPGEFLEYLGQTEWIPRRIQELLEESLR